jgi:hypothetical protein
MFQSLYALMSPPLYIDWEKIHRDSNGLITVKESWKKSKKLLIFHIAVYFVEHIMLCIPLVLFKDVIEKRNTELANFFPPVKDEMYSTHVVNVLIAVGILVAFVLPPIQYGLSHLYFKKGHPWSRILNAKLDSNKPKSVNWWIIAQMYRNVIDSSIAIVNKFVVWFGRG